MIDIKPYRKSVYVGMRLMQKFSDIKEPTCQSDSRDLENVLKRFMEAEGWPQKLLQKDCRILKRHFINNIGALKLLGRDELDDTKIPAGIKMIIQSVFNKILEDEINIENMIGDLKIQCPDQTIAIGENRIRIKSEHEQEYEIDRYCPHKGADLSKVTIFSLAHG